MTSPNLGHLFYWDYYRGLEDEDWERLVTEKKAEISSNAQKHIVDMNKRLTGSKVASYSQAVDLCALNFASQTFKLKTTYPGLLIGSGWDHSAGNIDGEFKIGFYFDYSTGLPVIPGPSVKGVIRSAFPNTENSHLPKEYKEKRKNYISACLEALHCKNIDVDKLEQEIFEGIRGGKPVPMSDHDVFYDAVIVSSEDHDGRFLGDDFVTPHKDKYKNPIPVKFLKVLPGVLFRFQFDLKNGLISAGEKKALLRTIILDLGVGAKTAVGYGQFEEVKVPFDSVKAKQQAEQEKKRLEAERQKRLQEMPAVDRIFEENDQDINSIINKLRNDELGLDESVKRELAARIKAVMIEQKIWRNPKQPKKKQRVEYVKKLLGE